jgi:hypothetical protein
MLRNVSAILMKHVSSQHFCFTAFPTHDACTTDHLIGFVQVDFINGLQVKSCRVVVPAQTNKCLCADNA